MSTEFKGTIDFTPAEKASHSKHILAIIEAAQTFLKTTWTKHLAFHKENGVSCYYGDRSIAYATPQQRQAALKKAGADSALEPQLQPTSCIGLTLKAMKRGFEAPNDDCLKDAWNKIASYTKANGQDGLALSDALQKIGWKILYWNPDVNSGVKWDNEEKEWRSKGYHDYNRIMVARNYKYNSNTVDDKELLLNFKTTIPHRFLEFPLFIGVANGGYHVFPGFYGEIIEAHSMRELSSVDNLEKSFFNPLSTGGGPRWTSREKYRSGIICVPPIT
jgi:hypothetical protein